MASTFDSPSKSAIIVSFLLNSIGIVQVPVVISIPFFKGKSYSMSSLISQVNAFKGLPITFELFPLFLDLLVEIVTLIFSKSMSFIWELIALPKNRYLAQALSEIN